MRDNRSIKLEPRAEATDWTGCWSECRVRERHSVLHQSREKEVIDERQPQQLLHLAMTRIQDDNKSRIFIIIDLLLPIIIRIFVAVKLIGVSEDPRRRRIFEL